jgi:methionyl-tRNA synthetase
MQKMYDAGDIELRTYEGQYCVPCEAYYNDDELVDGNCPIHMRPVEQMREENYFFLLSKYEDRLLDFYENNPEAVRPATRRNEVLGFIKQGLQDFSVSRTTIDWGVPLPWDPNHVAYVWADALVNYCTSLEYGTGDDTLMDRYWPEVHHIVGKDILRFHAVYWPAMLMSAGLTPPKEVFAHGWLLVGGEKMSKTRLNQIHPLDLVETFGSDGFRYHFLRDQPFGPDGDFSYEAMVSRYNSDLANNFGNLANRVVTMAVNYLDGVVPDLDNWGELQVVSDQAVVSYSDFLANTDFEHGFGAVWDLIRTTNAFIEQNEPWVLHKAGDADGVARVLGPCIQVLGTMAVCAWPLIPRAADELWRRLGQSGSPGDLRLPDAAAWPVIPPGSQLVKGGPLFPRINDDA